MWRRDRLASGRRSATPAAASTATAASVPKRPSRSPPPTPKRRHQRLEAGRRVQRVRAPPQGDVAERHHREGEADVAGQRRGHGAAAAAPPRGGESAHEGGRGRRGGQHDHEVAGEDHEVLRARAQLRLQQGRGQRQHQPEHDAAQQTQAPGHVARGGEGRAAPGVAQHEPVEPGVEVAELAQVRAHALDRGSRIVRGHGRDSRRASAVRGNAPSGTVATRRLLCSQHGDGIDECGASRGNVGSQRRHCDDEACCCQQ